MWVWQTIQGISNVAKLPSIPKIHSGIPKDIFQILEPMKAILQAFTDPLNPAIRASALRNLGVLGSDGVLIVDPNGGGDFGPPPAPTGLEAAGALANIILSWDATSNDNIAHTEIWRAETDDISVAKLIGTAPGQLYVDAIGGAATRFYWIRYRSRAAGYIVGPFNAQAGVQGETGVDPAYLIDVLTANPPPGYNRFLYVNETALVINGVTVPPGTYMSDAYIANGTITNAKIGNLAVDNAKIANLDAAKITTGYLNAARIEAGSISADLIDTRGLTIKDEDGNIIFGSGTPLDYSYIANVPSALTLTAVNLTIAGSTITKSAANGWDSSAYSAEKYSGGAYATATVVAGDKDLVFGLNTDPLTDSDFDSIDFGWRVKANGTLEIVESGVAVTLDGGTTPTPTPSPSSGVIVYWGDSTISGEDQNGEIVTTPAPAAMDAALSSFTVINEGVGGNSMKKTWLGNDGVHPSMFDWLDANPDFDYFIINCCINDSGTSTLAEFEVYLGLIINAVRGRGKTIILETPNECDFSQIDPYREKMVALAEENGVPLIDQYTFTKTYRESHNLSIYDMCPNGYHPNQAAYILKGQYAATRFQQIVDIGGTPAPAPAPAPSPTPAPAPTPGPAQGYVAPVGHSQMDFPYMTFREEFDGNAVDRDKWAQDYIFYEPGKTGQDNYDVTAGKLRAWATQPFVSPDEKTNFTLTTNGSFRQKYGYFEVRAKAPIGAGLWPAPLWLYAHEDDAGNAMSFRPEIDVAEMYCGGENNGAEGWSDSNNHPLYYAGSIHVPAPGSDGSTPAGSRGSDQFGPIDLSAAFYAYGVKWEPVSGGQKFTFYFRGEQMGDPIFTTNMNYLMYLIIDLWIGSASGAASEAGTPTGPSNAMLIDYVRCWALPGNVTVVSTTLADPANNSGATPTPDPTPTPAPTPTPSTTTAGTYNAGDSLSVLYDGARVRYSKNGTVVHTTTVTDDALEMYFDSSLFSSGASLSNIAFGPLGSVSWANIGGFGKPEDFATLGATFGTNIFGQMNAANISTYIAGAAIGTALIQNAAITNAQIANGAILNAHIADAQITNAKIVHGNILTVHIGDAQITNAKIADAQITSAKIGNAEVGTLKLAGNAVTIPVLVAGPGNGSVALNSGDEFTYGVQAVGFPFDTPVIIIGHWKSTDYGGGGGNTFMRIQVDGYGTVAFSTDTHPANFTTSHSLTTKVDLAAGSRNWYISFGNDYPSGVNYVLEWSVTILGAMR
jgi:beta-glucanase (GH16 family)/lysophospholipase L1-like esterase